MSKEADREFLFTYRFDGASWAITIYATDATQAKEKIKSVGLARYDGEVYMTIPYSLSVFGIIPRVIAWWKTLRSAA